MFISIRDFDTEERDDSHILITVIDSMGQPEEAKRLDITNYDLERWIQDGYLNAGGGAKNVKRYELPLERHVYKFGDVLRLIFIITAPAGQNLS